ncbi:MAG TPA: hypothetical protein VF614_04130 [Chthoniobacteraceae bacterium]
MSGVPGSSLVRDNTNAQTLAGTSTMPPQISWGNYTVFNNVPRDATSSILTAAPTTAGACSAPELAE